jgi:DNA-binding NarL/FixJ family response regulator
VRLLQDGLAHLLRDRDPLLHVDTIYPDDSFEARLLALEPDVILVDIVTLRRGIVARIQETVPQARIVVFAVDEVEEDLLACAEVGVAGFVGRDAAVEELLAAVASAQRGELHCSPRIAALMFERLTAVISGGHADRFALTSRQIQIVRLIEEGLSNKEIARQLSIEVSTVKNHVHNVLGKLRVNHRWQAPGVALPVSRVRGLTPTTTARSSTR